MDSLLTLHHQQRSVVGMDCMTDRTKNVVGMLYTTHHLTSVVNLVSSDLKHCKSHTGSEFEISFRYVVIERGKIPTD